MKNMKNSITSLNRKKLDVNSGDRSTSTCYHTERNPCPVDGKCKEECSVYKAAVIVEGESEENSKIYIGLSEPPFHERLRGHRKSFNHRKYSDTELSKHIWWLKDQGINYTIKWDIIKKCRKYKPGNWFCHLCVSEKYLILKQDRQRCLNGRSELVSKCRHKRKFLLERLSNGTVGRQSITNSDEIKKINEKNIRQLYKGAKTMKVLLSPLKNPPETGKVNANKTNNNISIGKTQRGDSMCDANYYDSQVGFKSIEKPKNPDDPIQRLLSCQSIDNNNTLRRSSRVRKPTNILDL